MAIPGQANINIANTPNDPVGSDSLFTAFNTIQNNFTQLFNASSPLNAVTAGPGIAVSYPTSNSVQVTNAGVTSLVAGNNITISSVTGVGATTGALIINATGGNGGGSGVTSVGVVSNSLTVTNSPIIASGNISVELSNTGVTPGNYRNPNVTIDSTGRVTSIANGAFTGVTSVGVIAGNGLSVSGSPVTGNSGGNTGAGNITIENTGVLSLTAGTGIVLSGNTGNITISSTGGGGGGSGTVTRVGVVSNSLTVTGSPIISSGNISVDLPSTISVTGIVANTGTIGSLSANTISITDPNSNPLTTTLYSNSVTYNTIISQRARGNASLPNAVTTNDVLLNIRGQGYTTFNIFQNSGSFSIIANGSPANSSAFVPSDVLITTTTTSNTTQVFTFTSTGNLSVPGVISGNGFGLTNITGANVTGTVANATYAVTAGSTTTAGTVTTAAQPNITSVGTLTSLSVSGTVTAANITANTGVFSGNGAGLTNLPGGNVTGTVANATYATSAGTVTTASQSNITSVGTLTSLDVSGNITAANITANTGVFAGNAAGLTNIPGGNVTGTVANATYATSAGTVTTASQSNITSVGTLTSLDVSGNITAANITANTGVFSGNAAGLTYIPAANLNGNVNNNISVSATANSNNTVGNIVSITINGTTYQLLAR